MSGQHLHDLVHRVGAVDVDDVAKVDTAQGSWLSTADTLGQTAKSLTEKAPAMVLAFGDSAIGNQGKRVFEDAAAKIRQREKEVRDAAKTLLPVATKLAAAQAEAKNPPDAPGPAPVQRTTLGAALPPGLQSILNTAAKNQHKADVAAYGAADERARIKIAELKVAYNDATAAMAVIHGDPHVPATPGTEDPGGTGGGRARPGAETAPPAPMPGHLTSPTAPPMPGGTTGLGNNPIQQVPGTPGYQPTFSDNSTPSTAGGPPVLGGNPGMAGGMAAAGMFGAPGALKGIRSALSSRTLNGAGTIGATNRAGGPATLGRPGAAGSGTGTGSPVSRTGGGRGGGRSGGAPGSQAGRRGGGRAGSRGAGIGSNKGRRNGEDRDANTRDLWDDGSDWIDDEGMGPAVLS
ncbi:MAG: hypothetical protein L0H31_06200 [Nocardioidaceae bacterium]|nr:hypothetical protein [Nocardioidaceae bacterium]